MDQRGYLDHSFLAYWYPNCFGLCLFSIICYFAASYVGILFVFFIKFGSYLNLNFTIGFVCFIPVSACLFFFSPPSLSLLLLLLPKKLIDFCNQGSKLIRNCLIVTMLSESLFDEIDEISSPESSKKAYFVLAFSNQDLKFSLVLIIGTNFGFFDIFFFFIIRRARLDYKESDISLASNLQRPFLGTYGTAFFFFLMFDFSDFFS